MLVSHNRNKIMEEKNMTNGQGIIHPKIKEFTGNLAHLLSKEEVVDIFRNGTPEQQLEQILIASDHLLQPQGNFILLNADLTLRQIFKADQ